jgi:hypothetical protein
MLHNSSTLQNIIRINQILQRANKLLRQQTAQLARHEKGH